MGAAEIELNGKRYDARTGRIIGDVSAPTPVKPASSGVAVDGFVSRSKAKSLQIGETSRQPKTTAKHTARELQKPQTLMRPAVKKPGAQVSPKQTAPKVAIKNPARIKRAGEVAKSAHISRFGTAQPAIVKKEAELLVVSPVEAQSQHTSPLSQIEASLHSATAHLETFEHQAAERIGFFRSLVFKSKAANIAAASFAVLVLVGFFGYQNKPAIEMRMAATRSGVSAHLPSYKPAGYGVVGSVKSQPGKVSVTFGSHSDDRSFKITQQASNWNSSALLANSVSKSNSQYQTYENDGRTVYIYDNSNATWVDGGIWYQIEGNAELTSDQLLRIANSF